MLTRAIEYDVLPTCLCHGMGVMTYSPLAGGWLSGTYLKRQAVSGPGSAARAQRPVVYDSSSPASAAKPEADRRTSLATHARISEAQGESPS